MKLEHTWMARDHIPRSLLRKMRAFEMKGSSRALHQMSNSVLLAGLLMIPKWNALPDTAAKAEQESDEVGE